MPSSKIYTLADIVTAGGALETEHGRLTLSEAGDKIVMPEQERVNTTLADVKVDGDTVSVKWTYRYWLARDKNKRARYLDVTQTETLSLSDCIIAAVQKASHTANAFETGTFTVVSTGEGRGKLACPADLTQAVDFFKSHGKSATEGVDGKTVPLTAKGIKDGWTNLSRAKQQTIIGLAAGF